MVRRSGRVNILSLLILAAIAGGVVWLYNYAPLYMDNLDVKDAVKSAYNDSARRNDDYLTKMILEVANSERVGYHFEDNGNALDQVKGLGLTPENVEIFRDEVRKTIRVSVNYDRTFVFKPGNSRKRLHFKVVEEGPFPPP